MFYTPTGTAVGDTYEYNQGTDIMTINVARTGSSAGAVVYAGGVDETGNGVGESSRPVKSTTSPAAGAIVCTSGAFSGERCSIKVIQVNVAIDVDLGGGATQRITGQVKAEQTQRANAAGQGDSGGPVYLLRSDGGVSAEGTITAIDTRSRLAPPDHAPAGNCMWRWWTVAEGRLLRHRPPPSTRNGCPELRRMSSGSVGSSFRSPTPVSRSTRSAAA
jgi:hypothetical protein